MTHRCHLPGCETTCPPLHLFCAKHWAMVPDDQQALVYETLKTRGARVDETWAPWWRAQAEATRTVMQKVYPAKIDLVEAHHARAIRFAVTLEEGEEQ